MSDICCWSRIKSLHFAINSAFRKIFLIKSYDAADECMSSFNCSVSEAIHNRKIKFLNKLQLSDNILFKTFAKSISEELVSLSSVDADIFWDIVMDIVCYFLFFIFFLVKLIKYLYFILVVWLNLYYHYWWNKDDQKNWRPYKVLYIS